MKKIRNVLFLLVAVVLMMGLLTSGCDQDGKETPGQTSSLPKTIGIATSAVGSAGYSIAVAYANVMEEILDIPVRILPTSSLQVNISQMLTGRALFVGGGITQNMVGDAIEANDVFADHEWGPQKAGFVWFNTTTPYGFFVRGDCKANDISELAGKKVSIYTANPSFLRAVEGILAFGGLTWDDVETVETGGYVQCLHAVGEGRADFTYGSPYTSDLYEIAENPHGIRFLPMPLDDEEGWSKYFALLPMADKGNCERGVDLAIGVPMVSTPSLLYTLMDTSEDAIYEIVKFFAEHFDDYKDAHPNLVDKHIDNVLSFIESGIGVPIHPGTVRYLKEIEKWSEEDEQWNNELCEKMDRYEDAWADAVDEAIEKNVEISHQNEEWIEIWYKHRSSVGLLKRRD